MTTRRRFPHPLLLLTALTLCGASTVALGGDLVIHIGPPQIGAGGSNPVSVPPTNPLEYEVEYATDSNWETDLATTPGVFFGKRSRTGSVYVGFGGGAVIDANGAGPGVYSSLGFEAGKGFKFNIEMKQAVGYSFSSKTVLCPYAIRMGVGLDL